MNIEFRMNNIWPLFVCEQPNWKGTVFFFLVVYIPIWNQSIYFHTLTSLFFSERLIFRWDDFRIENPIKCTYICVYVCTTSKDMRILCKKRISQLCCIFFTKLNQIIHRWISLFFVNILYKKKSSNIFFCLFSFLGYTSNALSSVGVGKSSLDPHSHLRQPGKQHLIIYFKSDKFFSHFIFVGWNGIGSCVCVCVCVSHSIRSKDYALKVITL